MKLQTLTIFIVLLGTLFIGFYSMLDAFAADEQYSVSVDSSYRNRYGDFIENITDETEDTRENLQDQLAADDEAQYFTGIWDAIKNGIKLIGNSFGAAFRSVSYLQEDLGIPTPIASMINMILVILFIVVIIGLILKIKA